MVDLGLRDEGGFVGERDRQTRAPIPDHISARPADLSSLINGLIEFSHRGGQEIDPVVSAAVLAFGFVYIHPFQDGNGRIHRYLIHHILAERGFNPPQVIFPVSSAIQDRLDEYKNVLESYSLKLLPFIEWEETKKHNVKVLNDTTDYYRYFDATLHAEFIYDCVCQTIEEDLPEEVAYLRNHDEFCERVKQTIDMPNQTLDLLVSFLDQNNGTLSKRARNKEFEKLTAEEIEEIEEIHRETFKE